MSLAMITSIANLADAESRFYRFGPGVRRSIKDRYHKARRADGRRMVQTEAQDVADEIAQAIAQAAQAAQDAKDAIRARYQKQWDEAWRDLCEQDRASIDMDEVMAMYREEEEALELIW